MLQSDKIKEANKNFGMNSRLNNMHAFLYGATHIFSRNIVRVTNIQTISKNCANFSDKSTRMLKQSNEQYKAKIQRIKNAK